MGDGLPRAALADSLCPGLRSCGFFRVPARVRGQKVRIERCELALTQGDSRSATLRWAKVLLLLWGAGQGKVGQGCKQSSCTSDFKARTALGFPVPGGG